jgi:hypothetical protein
LSLQTVSQHDSVDGTSTTFRVSVPDDPTRREVKASSDTPVALRVIGRELEVTCTVGIDTFALGPRI